MVEGSIRGRQRIDKELNGTVESRNLRISLLQDPYLPNTLHYIQLHHIKPIYCSFLIHEGLGGGMKGEGGEGRGRGGADSVFKVDFQ